MSSNVSYYGNVSATGNVSYVPGGGGPLVSFASANLQPGASTGTTAGTCSVSNATSITWSNLTGSGPFALNSSTGVITTTGAVTAQTYTGTVTCACTSGGETYTIVAPISIPCALAPTVPAAPTLTVAAGNAQNVLSWTDGSNGGATITAHNLYRSASAGSEVYIGQITTASPYTDTGLSNGTTYYYKLTAVNSVGESAKSTEQSATPTAATYMAAATRVEVPQSRLQAYSTLYQYRFSRMSCGSPNWAASNYRFVMTNRYFVVGLPTANGFDYVVEKMALVYNGTSYPILYQGNTTWTVSNNTDIITDAISSLTIPANSTFFIDCAWRSINSAIAISSFSYNSGAGTAAITLASAPTSMVVGNNAGIGFLTGTGSYTQLQGIWTIAAGSSGTTLNISGLPTGLTLTVTAGTFADFFPATGFLAIFEQGETSLYGSSTLAGDVGGTPATTDNGGLQLAPVVLAVATGCPSTTPVAALIGDSIANGKGWVRALVKDARCVTGWVKQTLDDNTGGNTRISYWDTCSIGNSWGSYSNTGYTIDWMNGVVGLIGNVPFNYYHDEVIVNNVGSNSISAMEGAALTCQNKLFSDFGTLPWVQHTPTTETSSTDGWTTLTNQTPTSGFGPMSTSTCGQATTLVLAKTFGSVVINATIDGVTGIAIDATTGKWTVPGFSTTLAAAITANQVLPISLTAQPTNGQQLWIGTDNNLTKSIVTSSTGAGPYSVYVTGDQGHVTGSAATKWTTAESNGATIAAGYTEDGTHFCNYLGNLMVAQAITQKSNIFALI